MLSAETKPLLSLTETWKHLPGKGEAVMRKLIAARWIAKVAKDQPYYRSSDLMDCIRRLSAGEVPKPVHFWKVGLGTDGAAPPLAHLVGLGNKSACGTKREWMTGAPDARKCTHCLGLAKTLNVEET